MDTRARLVRTVPVAAAGALLAVVLGPVGSAEAQEIETPSEGGSYPVLTYFGGECSPEDPLPPAPPGNTESGDEMVVESRSYTYTNFFHLSEDPSGQPGPTPLNPKELIEPTDGTHANDPGNVQKSDGPCKGTGFGDFSGRINGTPAAWLTDVGVWESISYRQRMQYWCCSEVAQGWWFECERAFEDPNCTDYDPEIIGTPVEFKVYNPCVFKVKKLKGHAVGTTVGSSKTHQLEEGDVIAGGEIIVREGGQLVVEGGDGVQGVVGPGTYSLTTRANCRRFRAPLPKTTPPIEVEEGSIFQKAASELESIVKAAKDLYHDGIFSKQRGTREPRQGGGQIAYRVIRDAKHKRTKSCAIKGSLRVYTTDRDVPAGKREIVLNAGECALTKDGGAPKRTR